MLKDSFNLNALTDFVKDTYKIDSNTPSDRVVWAYDQAVNTLFKRPVANKKAQEKADLVNISGGTKQQAISNKYSDDELKSAKALGL